MYTFLIPYYVGLQKTSPLPTPPPSPEKLSQLLVKLKNYEAEISQLSKEASEVKLISTELDIAREEIKHLTERERKMRISSQSLEEKIALFERELDDRKSRTITIERQCTQEKADKQRLREELHEKDKMLRQLQETNVMLSIIIYCNTQ